MSQLLIQRYLNELQTLRRVSGTVRESVVREAFKSLLKEWGRARDLIFIPEYEYQTVRRTRVYPDGALLYSLRVPLGYWEAKDEEDDLDTEIEEKFRKGYPQDNIIFEDSLEAVLIQNRQHVMRCKLDEPLQLERILDLFFSYERPEIADFRKAVEQFKTDLPEVLKALRDMIEAAERENERFRKAALRFLKHAKDTINPAVTAADVREMLIQHVLTEEIFSQVFDDSSFHRQNNVAKELYALENTFFTGKVKYDTLVALRPYYAAIKSAAALVSSHHEKQNFLKTIYENFYKVYNKKAADRLGVVYTPSEIVRFMIEGADYLCQEHFHKPLIEKQVEILDPAVGTGTFIAELIEHFRGQPQKLRYKYLEELHANEVAILPYYVANLNIEATYAAINGYEEYPNLCFVDTLDNVAALKAQRNQHVGDLFGAMSEENVARIKRQNKKKISVIIGNPPYNANQLNENEVNKNREYPNIDRRIKETYIAASSAQKTKLYDMYARFFRWASDRVDENGIVAFISNRSFIDTRTFDGFRKLVCEEFNDIYIVDLGGDVRSDPRLSGTKHNVFGIQTGVAISFMVKRAAAKGCRVRYARRPQLELADEKLEFLGSTKFTQVHFEEILPSPRYDWINQTSNDFDSFLPIADKGTKATKIAAQERAIFKLYSLGVATNRDEWVYHLDRRNLVQRVKAFMAVYEEERARWKREGRPENVTDWVSREIKWTSELEAYLKRDMPLEFNAKRIRLAAYRPFVSSYTYYDRVITHRVYQQDLIFPIKRETSNRCIVFTDPTGMKPWLVSVVDHLPDLHYVGAAAGAVCLPFRSFSTPDGADNITDWSLEQFGSRYDKGGDSKIPITKEAIFNYVYGVMHDPVYREKYGQNLKREFPRIPYYGDFWRWAEWGKQLMGLHLGYEAVSPWPLERVDMVDEKARKARVDPKVFANVNKDTGIIRLDSETQLVGVPAVAWRYVLGNRSALEWILDEYKEATPRDPTIREKFNTYRFSDHKERAIDLLKRVTRVSVETVKIVEAMRAEER